MDLKDCDHCRVQIVCLGLLGVVDVNRESPVEGIGTKQTVSTNHVSGMSGAYALWAFTA